jgi:NAD(P)-dependent dehydrogenase (short-subunit alcohol dehydrogenase family)
VTSENEPAAPRAVLVTGGTSGIGLAIALRLALRGSAVHLVARHASAAVGHVESAFAERGLERPSLHDADVAERAALSEIALTLRSGGVDIGVVVASAGTAVRALALEIDDDSVRRMIDTNLYGVFVTFQVFAPMVLSGADGRFIAISSMSALHGQRLRSVYAATKAGVSGLVRGLAAEWSANGATVNAIAPGILQTALTAGYMESNPDRAHAALAHSLVGRLGTVDDVATAAEYLASSGAGFVTGQTLVVDGGVTAGSTWW